MRALLLLCASAALACAERPVSEVVPPCTTVVTRGEIGVAGEDKHDLLFVVDDSPSMAEEQVTLQRQLPALVRILLSGDRDGDGANEFPPATDVHIGVVSADLGTAGAIDAVPGCSARGDDALLAHAPSDASCAAEYPSFLAYASRRPLAGPPPSATPDSVATDFSCIGLPGTAGCGYVQPLEAALQALRPDGANGGFLRSRPLDGLSLLGIVIVTDQDDCSVGDPSFFAAPEPGVSPAARCASQPSALFPITRYVEGLKALRSGNEQLVVVSAITGVPPEPVANVPEDFADNLASRDQLYGAVLADPRMQLTRQPDGTLAPACESASARATPAPRLVDAVRGFGANGMVLSICQDDWNVAIASMIAGNGGRRGGGVCLPRPMVRSRAGLTSCEVVWELPTPDAAPTGTITRCDEAAALLTRDAAQPIGENGGQRCRVHQLAVTGPPNGRLLEPGFGWFYDDFSPEAQRECITSPKQRINFSAGAEPMPGMRVSYECVQTRLVPPSEGELADPAWWPDLLDPCDPSTPDTCARALVDITAGQLHDGIDRTLACHPTRRECVVPCADGACPDGWQCNDESPPWCEPIECGP